LNIIQRIRKVTGLSQSKFSDLIDVKVSTIRQWERNGASPPSYVPKLILRTLIAEDNEYNEEELKVLQQWYNEQNDTRRRPHS